MMSDANRWLRKNLGVKKTMTDLNTNMVQEYKQMFQEKEPSDAISMIRDDIASTKILLKGYELKLRYGNRISPFLSANS